MTVRAQISSIAANMRRLMREQESRMIHYQFQMKNLVDELEFLERSVLVDRLSRDDKGESAQGNATVDEDATTSGDKGPLRCY